MIVVWRVTERCDLACPFCAYDRRLRRPRAAADPAAVLGFGAALAAYQRATGDPVLVSWLGGEPLRWRPLAALTVAFTRDLGLRVSATTNGTALAAPAVRAHVLAHYAELTVSVDGFAPVHDDLRGRIGLFETVRDAMRALARARRHAARCGPLLRANVVLMRDTIADFEPLCEELATWGIDEITFNHLGGADRPAFFPAHGLRAEDVATLGERVERLRGRLANAGVRLAGGDRYVERIRSSAAGRHLPVADCGPGDTFLFVNEAGLVAPCSFTGDAYAVPIGDLTTAADVATLPARFAARLTTRAATACADCPSTRVFAKFDADTRDIADAA